MEELGRVRIISPLPAFRKVTGMRYEGFRAYRLTHVAILQSLAFGLGDLIRGQAGWLLPAALLLGAAMLLLLSEGTLPRPVRIFGGAFSALVLAAQGLVLLHGGFPMTAAMVALTALGLLVSPFVAVDRASDVYANAHELAGPVCGLVLLGSAFALAFRSDSLPLLASWKVPMVVVGLLGGALYLIDPFLRVRLPVLRSGLGLIFTLPIAVAALSVGGLVESLAWLTWAVVLLYGDLREVTAWQKANDQLRAQQEELRKLNAALAESEERFRIAFHNAPIGMAMIDTDSRIIQANPSLCAMLGYSAGELVGAHINQITHPDDLWSGRSLFQAVVDGQMDQYQLEKRYIHKNGPIIWGHVHVSAARDANGQIRYILSQVQDITLRKRYEEQLRDLADSDPLTGVHNRRRFQEELEWAVALWRRYGTTGAVLLIDLDGFKAVNDSLGHHMGDKLLRQVAENLMREMRSTDLYGRLGGDEFACFLAAAGEEEAMAVAKRLLAAIERTTLTHEFRTVSVTGSAGVALLPAHATDAAELLIKADMAMYIAKRSGKNQVCLYGPEAARVFATPLR
jgi:diguanylate cyclase (GGDEF)-like protein/PAS domain S-box-containing protein